MKKSLRDEREFLRLAGTYLACRWTVMGNEIEGTKLNPGEWSFALLGMVDYAAEMRLMIEEMKR